MIRSANMDTDDPMSSSALIVSSLFSPQYRIMLIIGVVPIFGLGIPSADWMRICLFLWLDVFFEGLASSWSGSE